MSGKRYYPGYMNRAEYMREQMRQQDMVESITRGHSRVREKEAAIERLDELLDALEKVAQDLKETTMALNLILGPP